MKTNALSKVLERVDDWPPDAQDQLAEIALDIEAGLAGARYEPTADEKAGIDRGLRAAAEGRFPSDESAEAVLAKLRSR